MFLLFSVFFGIKLPNFYETIRLQNEAEATKDEKKKLNPEVESNEAAAAAAGSEKRSEVRVIVSGFCFFIVAAGTDAYFQSQTYTFGLCGPLALTPVQVGVYI